MNVETSPETETTDLAPETAEMANDMASQLFPEPETETSETPETSETSEKPETPETPVETKTEEPPVAETQPKRDRPNSWKKEALEKWDAIDPVVKAEILRREEDFFKGVEQYKQAADYGSQVAKQFQPFQQFAEQFQTDPVTFATHAAGVHARLISGDKQTRVQIIDQLASELGLTLADFAGTGEAEAPTVDPHVAHLQQSLQGVTMKLSAFEQAQQREARSKIESQISAFAADPKNKYFDEVSNDIARLISTGAANDLESAYNLAIRANPTVWPKVQSDLLAAAEAERNAEAAKKAKIAAEAAAKARKATSANVRTTSRTPAQTSKVNQSIDDTLNEVLERHFPS